MFRTTLLSTPLLAAAALCAAVPASAQIVPLELVVEDVEALPDAQVNLIVRTIEPLPLSAAAFAIEARERDDDLPIPAFAEVLDVRAFAGGGDAVVEATFDAETQRLEVSVTSESATLNDAYGPLAVVRLQLAPGLVDDLRFDLRMDPDATLVDALGAPVFPLAGRGRLRIVVPDPVPEVGLGAFGGETFPGSDVVAGAMSGEPYPIGSGTLEIVYDPSFAAGPPTITPDPRYGSLVIDSLVEVEPGHLLVDFHSPDGDLNADLHGLFLSVRIPSLPEIVPPATYAFDFGPATALFDPDGLPLPLEVEGDPVEFLEPELLFEGFFEEGDLMGWWDFVN